MGQEFRVAVSHKIDRYNLVGDKSKISEDLFWEMLETKVKELTKELPDKYEETLEKAKKHLMTQKTSLTVANTWFEIRRKKIRL